MHKRLLILLVAGIPLFANAQKGAINLDSTVSAFKNYLLRNVKYPALAKERNVQGRIAVSIHLNKSKLIDSAYLVRHIDKECDSLVLTKIKSYTSPINLPESTYTIGLAFFILADGKPDSEIKLFNAAAYKNFLFELHVTTEAVSKIYSVY